MNSSDRPCRENLGDSRAKEVITLRDRENLSNGIAVQRISLPNADRHAHPARRKEPLQAKSSHLGSWVGPPARRSR
jgi:hypothetical protein